MSLKRFALTALLLTAVVILLLASVGARRGRGCSPAVFLAGAGGCGSVTSQNKIDWEQEPVITADGYLVMRGQTKDAARIHDAASVSGAGRTLWPAFNISAFQDDGLNPVASIWPRPMASRLAGGATRQIFANGGDYQVSVSQFYVKAKLPDALLHPDARLVVSVWPPNPGGASALGATCVDRE